MDSRDCVRLAHALAKAAVQPRASAATIEQCTYQIALLLARDNTLHVDLGAWRQLIEEHRESLELAADQASFERGCLAALENMGHPSTSCDPLPRVGARARPESF